VKVAAIQHDIVWEAPATNFARLAPRIAEAADDGARLVALTEMFATGFSMDTERLAEAPDGPSVTFLLEQAQAHDIWVCGSIAERTPGYARATNRFVLAGPDGTTERYSKIHPFTYGGEPNHYDAGSTIEHWVVDGVRITPFVCYDLRFADEFWQVASHTDMYLVVANWPASRRTHWMSLLGARAIENQAYVVGVNRVGTGGGLEYSGDSRIVGPFGELFAEASPGIEETLSFDIDPAHVEHIRTRFPFLRDRR
jgi:predicted amidohydrolase